MVGVVITMSELHWKLVNDIDGIVDAANEASWFLNQLRVICDHAGSMKRYNIESIARRATA